jgi:hypothetical protein
VDPGLRAFGGTLVDDLSLDLLLICDCMLLVNVTTALYSRTAVAKIEVPLPSGVKILELDFSASEISLSCPSFVVCRST